MYLRESKQSEHEKVRKQVYIQMWETVEQKPEPEHSGLHPGITSDSAGMLGKLGILSTFLYNTKI